MLTSLNARGRLNYTKTAGNFLNLGEGSLSIMPYWPHFGCSRTTLLNCWLKNKVIWLVFLQPVLQLGTCAVVCGAKDFEVRP